MPTPPLSTPKRRWFTALLLAVVAIVLYSPATGYDFLNYDDQLYVADNPAVQAGLSWAGVKYAFTSTDGALGAPLTWLSFMADTTLLGPRASSYHTTNVLLHGVVAGAMFLAFEALLAEFWTALFIAALFTFHPLRTESVAWITERKDLLNGLFWALGLLAYQRYATKPNWRGMLPVTTCYALGLLGKFMMVTFPFVLLLLDVWPLKRMQNEECRMQNWKRCLVEKIPMFALTIAAVLFTAQVQGSTGTLRGTGHHGGGDLPRVLENYVFYLGQILWPFPRAILYPVAPWHATGACLSALLLAIITLVAVRERQRHPWVLVGWLWFIGTLVPVIGFVGFGNFTVADRYTYLPSLGLTLIVVMAVQHWAKASATRMRWAGTAGAVVVAGCVAATAMDLPRWRDSVTLFSAAARPGAHPEVFLNLSSELVSRGDFTNAIAAASQAIAASPRSADAYNNRANARAGLGDWNAALADYDAALQLKPRLTTSWANRAVAWCNLTNYVRAIEDASQALALEPRNANALNTRGNAKLNLGDTQGALTDFDTAIAVRPGLPISYHNRASVWLARGDLARARADLTKVRELGAAPDPGLAHAVGLTPP